MAGPRGSHWQSTMTIGTLRVCMSKSSVNATLFVWYYDVMVRKLGFPTSGSPEPIHCYYRQVMTSYSIMHGSHTYC